MVHVPTKTMWNRHGTRLAISREFGVALDKVAALHQYPDFEWLDCETLARRHDFAKGTLVVLDIIDQTGCLTYEARRVMMTRTFQTAGIDSKDWQPDSVYTIPSYPGGPLVAHSLWFELKALNQGKDSARWFYEGVLCKRLESHYPIQLNNPENEFSGWVKYRFPW